MGYIDIHAHIIAGVDDGAETIEESKRMLQNAFKKGFTTIIATPHCNKGFANYSKNEIIEQCEILNQFAKENISSDFSVLPGQEIYCDSSSMKMISSGQILPLANSKYVLLEFDPDVSFSNMRRAIREVTMSNYFVILAHIERYACLYDPDNIQEIRRHGALMQMNYSDIGGKWYRKNTAFCRKCLRNKYVDFLGTDIHSANENTIKYDKAINWLNRHLDNEYIKCITESNAVKILLTDKGQ